MNDGAEEVRRAVRRWWRLARDDLKLAELAANSTDPIYTGTLFHAQQAVEKAIKTVLVAEQIPFQRSHDLRELLRAVPVGWSVRTVDAEVDWLTPWAVISRYPANLPDPTAQMADRALADARAMLDLVKVDLDDQGWLG